MSYTVFMDGVKMPVTPSKIQIKIKNQNKTINLINDSEVNILKSAGLSEINFDVRIPQTSLPFASYEGGFKGADYFLSLFEKMKTERKAFQFICSRVLPTGKLLFDTNMKVSLEDYTITDDADEGFDLIVSLKLKQYKDYSAKKIKIVNQGDKSVGKVSKTTTPPPKSMQTKTYKVVKGDSLWNIAKKCLGDGSKYKRIYEKNKSTIDGRNKGTGNSKYTIYPGQVLLIP